MLDNIEVHNKYTVVVGSRDGEWIFKALRYGEDWIDNLTMTDGSNLILAMAYEIQKLRSELETR